MPVNSWDWQVVEPLTISSTEKSFTTEALIQMVSEQDPVDDILNHPQCPVRFQTNRTYPVYFCLNIEIDQNAQTPDIRRLKASWSNTIPEAYMQNGMPVYPDNPLQRPLRFTSDFYTFQRPMRMTYNYADAYDASKGPPAPTVPVITTAGEPIFLSIEDEVRCFNCTKNVSGLPAFMGKGGTFTNVDPIRFAGLVFAPIQLLICNITLSEPKFAYGLSYYEMRFKLLVAPDGDGWVEKVRNAGYHEKASVPIKDRSGTKIYNYLKAINVGPPEQPMAPSSPVLIGPDGVAYRSPGPGQTNTTAFKDRTGPVLSSESPVIGGIGVTAAMWKLAELKFYPRLAISFNAFVPLN